MTSEQIEPPNQLIDYKMACRLKLDRGLDLPVDGEYVDERLKQIAIRYAELEKEINLLDWELFDKVHQLDYEELTCL
jgi:hypothetical protein